MLRCSTSQVPLYCAAMNGREFKALRLRLGMAQWELGEAIGRGRFTITAIEHNPDKPVLQIIAMAMLALAHGLAGPKYPSLQRPHKAMKRAARHTLARHLYETMEILSPTPGAPKWTNLPPRYMRFYIACVDVMCEDRDAMLAAMGGFIE